MPSRNLTPAMLVALKEGYEPENMQVTQLWPGDSGYVVKLRNAFDFFRAFDNGRYSSRSKMRIASAADLAGRRHDDGSGDGSGLPVLVTLDRPFRYDEETEVKSGGTAGMAVVWIDDDGGRLMLAVHRNARANGLGSAIMQYVRGVTPGITTWVNRTNTPAQRFLLRNGFMPIAINSSGAVCYSTMPAEGEDEDEDAGPDGSGPWDSAPARPTSADRSRVLQMSPPTWAFNNLTDRGDIRSAINS